MTIYYVRKSGNDSNAGTGTSVAWLTINRALSASGTASGDTVYIGSGVYREKVLTALTNPTVETFVIGDTDGAQTGDASGEIRITNYRTDDVTAPTNDYLMVISKNYLTFQNITFQGHFTSGLPGSMISSPNSHHITFRNCAFLISSTYSSGFLNLIAHGTVTANQASYLTIDRCRALLLGYIQFANITSSSSNSTSFDDNVVVQNSIIQGGLGVFYGGGATGTAGGLSVRNNIIASESGECVYIANGNTARPAGIYNNILYSSSAWGARAINMEAENTAVEDYNYIIAFLARPTTPNDAFDMPAGTHSIDDGSKAPLIHLGQELIAGQYVRPVWSPTADSPLLGFGSDGLHPSVDILNRPRPAGGQSTGTAVGAYERHDTGIEDTSVFDSAPASMKIVGPGDHDFEIPVNPISTNITIMVRYDTNHGETNKPQVQILANPSIGVSAETLTMTDVIDTWETLSFSNFTPTDYGIIILRCISRSATGNGIAYFDSITV